MKINAENVLKIANVAVGFKPDLDVSHVGRQFNGTNIEIMSAACIRLNLSPDQLVLEGRKAVIRCASFYHRFNEDVEKPGRLALAYLDGKFDMLPNFVMEYVAKQHTDNLDLSKITMVKKNEYKIGDPSGEHINVSRICADPVVFMCNTFSASGELTDETRVDCSYDKDPGWLY